MMQTELMAVVVWVPIEPISISSPPSLRIAEVVARLGMVDLAQVEIHSAADSVGKVLCDAHAFLKAADALDAVGAEDHVNLRKIAQRISWSSGEGLYCRSSSQADLGEIFTVALLSTFQQIGP